MSVAGISSKSGEVGSQYDFKNMSNKQLNSAATTLQSEGKISVDQMAAMQYVAQGANRVSVTGATEPIGVSVLNRTGSTDFAVEFQGIYESMKQTPGSVGAELYKSLADLMSPQQNASNEGLSTVA